jgi:aspartyl-tRNA(Asn)/glutamyl-tRNA(Gln) amidotransferase subunit A
MPLAWTMDKIGPMCRTAEDCGLVLQVIAGKDGQDPASAGKSFYFAPRYAREANAVRVAYAPSDFSDHAAPATRKAFNEAFEVFKGIGVQTRELSLPDVPYGPLVGTIISAEGSSVFEELITSGRVDQLADERQIAGLRAGLEIPARDYLRAMRLRRGVQEQMRKLFAEVDVMLSPARFDVAPPVDQPLDQPSPPSPGVPERDGGMRSLISAGNLAGLPALTVPCGFVDSLPVALQLVGRPFSENLLLALGMEFQRRTDFHTRRPG